MYLPNIIFCSLLFLYNDILYPRILLLYYLNPTIRKWLILASWFIRDIILIDWASNYLRYGWWNMFRHEFGNLLHKVLIRIITDIDCGWNHSNDAAVVVWIVYIIIIWWSKIINVQTIKAGEYTVNFSLGFVSTMSTFLFFTWAPWKKKK